MSEHETPVSEWRIQDGPGVIVRTFAAELTPGDGRTVDVRIVPYGERITPEKLERVGAAERLIRGLGFRQVRVRHHGNLARIEVTPGDVGRLAGEEVRQRVVEELRRLGFTYVTLDLQGFRSGSMNEPLAQGPQGTRAIDE